MGRLIRAAVRLGALSAGDGDGILCRCAGPLCGGIGLAFRFRMTFWMWWAILQRWVNVRGADQQLGEIAYPALLGVSKPGIKPGT